MHAKPEIGAYMPQILCAKVTGSTYGEDKSGGEPKPAPANTEIVVLIPQ